MNQMQMEARRLKAYAIQLDAVPKVQPFYSEIITRNEFEVKGFQYGFVSNAGKHIYVEPENSGYMEEMIWIVHPIYCTCT